MGFGKTFIFLMIVSITPAKKKYMTLIFSGRVCVCVVVIIH